jgi:hypothetical protein
VRKLLLLVLAVMLLAAFGCSGNNSPTAPEERVSMEDFFAGFTVDDSIAGYYSITDLDGNTVAEGTMVRDESGKLAMGEMRQSDIVIDLTWMGWIDADVEYLNHRGYTPEGYVIYYIGDSMQYRLCLTNYASFICCANVQTEQRYYLGSHHLELMPGDPIETWYDVILPVGVTCLEDDYLCVPGTIPGLDLTWCKVWFTYNIWCLHFDIVIYDCIAGIWDP